MLFRSDDDGDSSSDYVCSDDESDDDDGDSSSDYVCSDDESDGDCAM